MLKIKSKRNFVSEITWGKVKDQLKTLQSKNIFAVVDNEVIWFFDKRIKKQTNCKWFELEVSEKNKCQETVDSIIDFLLKNNAGRDSMLLSVGGGVTSDITGYAASIYKRGIPWISIPTTLLAQVDASVGGKTAINSEYGKNVIGSFYPPQKVIMTHEPSQTWTDEIELEGIAEMIKIFLVFELSALKPLISKGTKGFDDSLIKKSVEIKAEVVKKDPWENNLRASLNYGHTFGHAIETVCGIRHGIAVSFGIRIANYIACLLNIMQQQQVKEINSLLDKLNFPHMGNMPNFNSILPFILQDKKIIDDNIMMVLVDGLKSLPIKPISPVIPVPINILEEGYNLAIKGKNP